MAIRGMKKRIGDMLIEENLITQEQLEKALKLAKESGFMWMMPNFWT